jgi:hypothetical protein
MNGRAVVFSMDGGFLILDYLGSEYLLSVRWKKLGFKTPVLLQEGYMITAWDEEGASWYQSARRSIIGIKASLTWTVISERI